MSELTTQIEQIPAWRRMSQPMRFISAQILEFIGTEQIISDGETLFSEGDDHDISGAVILEGLASISAHNQNIKIVSSPDILGEMQQLSDTSQRSATVTASGNIRIIRFRWHEFIKQIQDRDDLNDAQKLEIKRAIASVAGERLDENKPIWNWT
jgi:hypothetical protein